jgi:anti-sigma factor RsiW
MSGENKTRMQCTDFEALLADVLDGTLAPVQMESFQAHLAQCDRCAPMFAEAEAGLKWLDMLHEEEVEPPAHMVNRILTATIGTAQMPSVELRARKSWVERVLQYPWVAPVIQTVRQPRFAMSFAMAFFSVTMLLNVAGVRFSELKTADLRPSAIMRGVSQTQGKVVRYWDNIRFVYEVESKVRDLKRATTPEGNKQEPQRDDHKTNNKSRQPEQDNYRNYSRDESRPVVAENEIREQIPVAAHRRFV